MVGTAGASAPAAVVKGLLGWAFCKALLGRRIGAAFPCLRLPTGRLPISATTVEPSLRAWLSRSFALHELNRTREAFDLLLPVAEKFSQELVIPYNLACYCAQLGRFDQGREWFKKALAIDEKSARAAAIFDPDLKPRWDSMSGTIWKRCE